MKYDARPFLDFFLCVSLRFSKCFKTSANDNSKAFSKVFGVIWYMNRPFCLLFVAPTKYVTCSFHFCTILVFLKMASCRLHDKYWAVNLGSLGLDTLSSTETSKPCIISKHGSVVHKFKILQSLIVEWTSILDGFHGANSSHLDSR